MRAVLHPGGDVEWSRQATGLIGVMAIINLVGILIQLVGVWVRKRPPGWIALAILACHLLAVLVGIAIRAPLFE